jgi:hypothetical protein
MLKCATSARTAPWFWLRSAQVQRGIVETAAAHGYLPSPKAVFLSRPPLQDSGQQRVQPGRCRVGRSWSHQVDGRRSMERSPLPGCIHMHNNAANMHTSRLARPGVCHDKQHLRCPDQHICRSEGVGGYPVDPSGHRIDHSACLSVQNVELFRVHSYARFRWRFSCR